MFYTNKLVPNTESRDPEWCNYVDCSANKAVESCKITCSEPKWCELADCSKTQSTESCKKSCKMKGTP